jgi:hypothetical protein
MDPVKDTKLLECLFSLITKANSDISFKENQICAQSEQNM